MKGWGGTVGVGCRQEMLSWYGGKVADRVSQGKKGMGRAYSSRRFRGTAGYKGEGGDKPEKSYQLIPG